MLSVYVFGSPPPQRKPMSLFAGLISAVMGPICVIRRAPMRPRLSDYVNFSGLSPSLRGEID